MENISNLSPNSAEVRKQRFAAENKLLERSFVDMTHEELMAVREVLIKRKKQQNELIKARSDLEELKADLSNDNVRTREAWRTIIEIADNLISSNEKRDYDADLQIVEGLLQDRAQS